MSFWIRPISFVNTPRSYTGKLVHEADRDALAELHRATVTVWNEDDYATAIRRVLEETPYPPKTYPDGGGIIHGCFPPHQHHQQRQYRQRQRPRHHVVQSSQQAPFTVDLNRLLPQGMCKLKSCDVEVQFDRAHRITHLKITKFGESPRFPFGMKLPRLKKLCLYSVDLPPPAVFCKWVRDNLPGLEHLEVYGRCETTTAATTAKIPFFTDATCFPRTLRDVYLSYWSIDAGQIETFLFDVWPKYPAITSVGLGVEGIESFRSIRRRLRTADIGGLVSSSGPGLRTLTLYHNNKHVDRLLRDDPEEVAAVCDLLRAVSNLRICLSYNKLFVDLNNFTEHAPINFENLLNWGGRCVLEGKCCRSGGGGQQQQQQEQHQQEPPLSLSLWPKILVRLGKSPVWNPRTYEVDHETDRIDHASAVFYFLRNGPNLWGETGD